MKYLLVLGFACDVYRQKPRARIFIGNKLIDEFYIPCHKDTLNPAMENFWKNKHRLEPFSQSEWTNINIKNFPPLRFYLVKIDPTLDRTELRIEIENSDSNNTNGFITKSTLLTLTVCCFFPLHKKLLLRLNEIKNKNRLIQNYAWYRSSKNWIFNLIMNGLHWQEKNVQIFNSNRYNLSAYSLGGDGVFTCELVKKYQILINKIKKSNRYIFDNILIDYFLNKYEQHENQRNTD